MRGQLPRVPLSSGGMEETEKFFTCPFCRERISMIIDLSVEGEQTYVEDCEVCCRPIQLLFEIREGRLRGFRAHEAYEA